GFKLLTALLGLLPAFIIRLLLWSVARNEHVPGTIGALLRQINLGLRGVVFTLYYSNLDEGRPGSVYEHLSYQSGIRTPILEDTEMETLLQQSNPLANRTQPPLAPAGSDEVAGVFDAARRAQGEIAALSVEERLNYISKL